MIDPYKLSTDPIPAAPRRPPRPAPLPVEEPGQAGSAIAPVPVHHGLEWRDVIILIMTIILVVVITLLAVTFFHRTDTPSPLPDPTPAPVITDYDPAFVPLGREYAKTLGTSYGRGELEAGVMIGSGQDLQTSNDKGQKTFHDGRVDEYERIITPAIQKLIGDKTDDQLTSEDRIKIKRAKAGIAKGAGVK